ASPSILSSDLTITGNLKTTGNIQVEGKVEGDIRAHLLTIGETALIKGEVIADDVVVNGRVVGKIRGLKVRLTATARVEGDIIHKTIAIESGAHFEGSVQRQEDPLNSSSTTKKISEP
ncbi:MAG: polymer-forming cytoskeletal protein, partial [Proteobacteria bacterium]|nr:polymer-forming cytoskeletal protein [Pseudomonadota bacterium]